jgi:LacI family transcriptional regulator
VACVIEHGALTSEFGEVTGSRLLTSADPPTAIITSGYSALLGLLTAIKALGLRVPDDVSVISFDDLASAELIDPAVSTLSAQPLELGRRAGELLLASFAGETPAHVVVTAIFRPRASCGPPPAATGS